ncbi:molybdopterin-binding protein [Clostridiales bacterium PH28_bin88]|nr:molybdopterin-binding protein [Clostridiales bacterium PH28_bin88]
MRHVRVEDAVGHVLCHDITKIVPGEFKGRAFKKGHIIRPEDVPELLKLGKEHLYVWEYREGILHEDEAAQRIAAAAGRGGLTLTEPVEGKVNLQAAYRGLLKVDVTALTLVNSIDQVVLATLHNNRVVESGQVVAGTRVIPIVIEEEKIRQVEAVCAGFGGIIEVKPFKTLRVGMVTTGNEVYHGRIKDRFGPVVRRKLEPFGSEVFRQVLVPDDAERIAAAIRELVTAGAEMVITTGGMSVDPDDVTPLGVRQAGAELVTYGAPVLPGSMYMIAYLGDIPVMGLPGCVMYAKTTIFDLVLPRVMAGERIIRSDLVGLGHGGICLECKACHFPNCSFGKGC